MGRHVTVGRGAVGNGVAEQLRDAGQEVVQLNRRGGAVEEARGLSFDATDQEALAAAARSGADGVYNCVNPPYDKWVRSWPTLAASLLQTAEQSGAGLDEAGRIRVTEARASDFYGPGVVDTGLLASRRYRGCSRARPFGCWATRTCRSPSPTSPTWHAFLPCSVPMVVLGGDRGTCPRRSRPPNVRH